MVAVSTPGKRFARLATRMFHLASPGSGGWVSYEAATGSGWFVILAQLFEDFTLLQELLPFRFGDPERLDLEERLEAGDPETDDPPDESLPLPCFASTSFLLKDTLALLPTGVVSLDLDRSQSRSASRASASASRSSNEPVSVAGFARIRLPARTTSQGRGTPRRALARGSGTIWSETQHSDCSVAAAGSKLRDIHRETKLMQSTEALSRNGMVGLMKRRIMFEARGGQTNQPTARASGRQSAVGVCVRTNANTNDEHVQPTPARPTNERAQPRTQLADTNAMNASTSRSLLPCLPRPAALVGVYRVPPSCYERQVKPKDCPLPGPFITILHSSVELGEA